MIKSCQQSERNQSIGISVEVSEIFILHFSFGGEEFVAANDEERYFIDRLSFTVYTVFKELWNEMFDNSIDTGLRGFMWLFTCKHFKLLLYLRDEKLPRRAQVIKTQNRLWNINVIIFEKIFSSNCCRRWKFVSADSLLFQSFITFLCIFGPYFLPHVNIRGCWNFMNAVASEFWRENWSIDKHVVVIVKISKQNLANLFLTLRSVLYF